MAKRIVKISPNTIKLQPVKTVKKQPVFQEKVTNNPINAYFDKIFCINLKKRTDRWMDCLHEFEINGLKVERFLAIEGKKSQNQWMSGGRLGCALSHLELLRIMVQRNYGKILVLEDDVQFVDGFSQRFKEAMPFIPDFDILYFGGNNPQILETTNEYVCQIKQVFTTHAYSISVNFAKHMIPNIAKLNDAVDCLYAQQTPNFKSYIFMPYLATQRPSFSDIEGRLADYSALINEDFINK